MKVKVSDLMLDLATGDASIHDAYIQEACGKVDVASAIYNASCAIANMPDSMRNDTNFVQEAASANLPTDADNAKGVACEAVKQQLNGLFDAVVSASKKVKEVSDKNMKLLVACGKKYGVSMSGGAFDSAFVKPLCEALAKEKDKLSIDGKKFLKGKTALKLAENYGKGVATLLCAYGIDLDAFGDGIVKTVVRSTSKCDVSDLGDVASLVGDGAKLVCEKKNEDILDKESNYTDKITANDVRDLCIAVYTTLTIAKEVASLSAGDKKTAKEAVKTLCSDNTGDKKITKSCDKVNENASYAAKSVAELANKIAKGYGDSVSTLVTALK